MTAVELRVLGRQLGIKGASKGKRLDLLKGITTIRHEQLAAAEAERAAAEAEQQACAAEAATSKMELDETRNAPPAGGKRIGRKGQAIYAKGDKYAIVAAEAERLAYVVSKTTSDGNTILQAIAGIRHLTLMWDAKGRYIYSASSWKLSASEAGKPKARRVRNVAEALRLLAG